MEKREDQIGLKPTKSDSSIRPMLGRKSQQSHSVRLKDEAFRCLNSTLQIPSMKPQEK